MASDGNMDPIALVERAHARGVSTLALTDHDTTQGLSAAAEAAARLSMNFINGIELSTTWHGQALHVVGLNINPSNDTLQTGIQSIQAIRLTRAKKIAAKLEAKKIPGAWEAISHSAKGGMITRSHFAEFLNQNGFVNTQQEAFDRYLGRGKAAYVATHWANLEDAIAWILEAGGVAVLAHPMRYKLSATKLRHVLGDFKSFGGQAVELVTGRSSDEEIRLLTQHLLRFDLYASVGSDFHNSSSPWIELGRLKALPEKVKPVWSLWH